MSDKHNLEFNKLAAAILLAGIIAMVCGLIADGFYTPKEAAKRGFHVDVTEDTGGGDAAAVAKPLVDAGTLLAHADAAKGNDIVQKKCTSCHDFSQGGPNKVGPNLYGIVGRAIGSKADYSYSDPVKGHGGTWGYDELNHWLFAPAQYIKGTKMGFAGLKNDEERGNVIAYLKSISPSAPAIPAPNPQAAPEQKAGGTDKPTNQPKAAGGDEKPGTIKSPGNTANPAPATKDTGTDPKAVAASKDVKDSQANLERKSGEAARQPNNSALKTETNQSQKAADKGQTKREDSGQPDSSDTAPDSDLDDNSDKQ